MIYFILSTSGLVNIGKIDKIERIFWLLKEYSDDPHKKFTLLGKIEGTDATLRDIYQICGYLHSHRKWYKSDQNLLNFIKNLEKKAVF